MLFFRRGATDFVCSPLLNTKKLPVGITRQLGMQYCNRGVIINSVYLLFKGGKEGSVGSHDIYPWCLTLLLSDKTASVDRTSKLGVISICHNVGYHDSS